MYEKLPKIEQNLTLKDFQREVQRLKDLEAKESGSIHLRDLDPKNLNEEDMKIYNDFYAIKDEDSLNRYTKEFEAYRSKIIRDRSAPQDRIDFYAFIGNMIMGKANDILNL